MEMMIDSGAQLWAENSDGLFYAYEMCDAVEAEEYDIDGIAVSDFLYPSFFESWHKVGSVQFDYLKKVDRPFQTLHNGDQIVSNGKSTREVFGSLAKARHFQEVEVRKLHRSEYRKQVALHSARLRPMRADSDLRTSRAALLHQTGRFLTALAAVMEEPLPGETFELAPGGRNGPVELLPAPSERAGSGRLSG
jgi:hypothetical protein